MTKEIEKILTDQEQNVLDGECSSAAAAAEETLPGEFESRNRVAAFVQMEHWLQATRPQAPSLLVGRIASALQEIPARRRTIPFPTVKRKRAAIAVLAAAAALFVAIRIIPGLNPLVPSGEEAVNMASEHPANTVRYQFTFQALEAKEVCIAGNFNRWKVCETPLQRVGEDLWSVSVELPKGRHEYMFVVDGNWVSDPTANGYVQDGFGHRNAVLQL